MICKRFALRHYGTVKVKLPIARRNFVHLPDAENGQIHSNQIVKISVLTVPISPPTMVYLPPTLVNLPLTKQPELCNELETQNDIM